MTEQSSANLSLPYIQPAQAQKHVTHNEAIRILDALVQPVVEEPPRDTPPASAEEGQRYLIGDAPNGAWAGQAGAIAWRTDGAWSFLAPQPGWTVRVLSDGSVRAWLGGVWQADSGSAQISNPSQLGINTSADATNRLAVSSDATLLSHDGDSHQLKVNKATTGDTASVLFQTGFSGRAEFGTTGSDDFSVKVSPDGANWSTTLEIAVDTGVARFPAGAQTTARLDMGGRFYCYDNNRWVTHNNIQGTAGENVNYDGGTGAEPEANWTYLGPVVPAGAQMQSLALATRASNAEVTGFDIRLCFQTGPWGNGWDDASAVQRSDILAADGITLAPGMNRYTADLGGFTAQDDGMVLVFIRPTGTLSALRYLFGSLSVTYLTPS